MNFLPVQITGPLRVTHPEFSLTLPDRWEETLRSYHNRAAILGIRPEHMSLSAPASKNLPVTIERIEALGSETYLAVKFGETTLQVRVEPDHTFTQGDQLWLAIAPEKVHLFDLQTDQALMP
jgi:multiple sugar transport system ATP-binding protein